MPVRRAFAPDCVFTDPKPKFDDRQSVWLLRSGKKIMTGDEEYDRRRFDPEENMKLLDRFESWIKSKELSEATAAKHRANVYFYINEFLMAS